MKDLGFEIKRVRNHYGVFIDGKEVFTINKAHEPDAITISSTGYGPNLAVFPCVANVVRIESVERE